MPAVRAAVVVATLLAAVLGQTAPSPRSSLTKINLNPVNIRYLVDTDYQVWTIPAAKSASSSFNNVDFTLTAGGGSTLYGNYYKFAYTRFLSSLGERVVDEGITTQDTAALPITLTLTGLSVGNHTLLAWHNCWDALTSVSPLNITVDGQIVAENVAQSVRSDNVWQAATSYIRLSVDSADQVLNIVYTPTTGNTTRVYLNGFVIDGPATGNLVSFPSPLHNDEHVDLGGGNSLTASWTAPKLPAAPKYNVYLGTSPTELKTVAYAQVDTEAVFTGLNAFDTYYWRVDVVDGCHLNIGNVFKFRVAQLAFPGAEGYGRFARGGRGGKVVHVTTLEDTSEPGSLRHALTIETGPRTVVFDVGGVITTTARMSVNDTYITLAGQTAPGKGIVVQGWPIGLTGASDVIFRHVRVRPGKVSGTTIDGMGMQGSNHCIFDRCSMGWAIDESFSSRSAYNITFQRNFISEPLNIAGHQNYPPGTKHGFSASISGDIGSFHHNLLAHAEGRSWSMAGNVDNAGFFAGRLDIRNNVVYNFGDRVTDGGCHEVNFVGNYYKQGPASYLTYDMKAQYENQLPGTQQYYCSGNSMYQKNGTALFPQDSAQYPTDDPTKLSYPVACWAAVTIDPPPAYQKFFDTPWFESYVETQPSNEAYKRVLSDCGAQQPIFDDHDTRIVNETLTGTYTYVGSVSGELGIIDDPADVGGLEHFPTVTRDSSWDADGDGIADWWDGSTGGEGYTSLEGYLNFMADPHSFVEPGAVATIDLASLTTGFVAPIVFSVSGASKGTATVNGSKATYTAGLAGIDHLTVDFVDAEGSAWSRAYGVAVFTGASKAQ
ncbi:pectate lyase [Thozetella sp. PMI_491]|nr:pectate lyase [Thozetella sp. PMI_491]